MNIKISLGSLVKQQELTSKINLMKFENNNKIIIYTQKRIIVTKAET